MAIKNIENEMKSGGEERKVFLNSLIISIICHMLIMTAFIVLIRPNSMPTKPSFIFLGSILHKSDLSTNNSQRFMKPGVIEGSGFALHDEQAVTTTQPLSKPRFPKNPQEDIKIMDKSLVQGFITDENLKKEKKTSGKEDPSPIPSLPPYKSLKFHSHD